MNSIFPSFIQPTPSLSLKEGNIQYHYHKFEIVDSRPSRTSDPLPLSRADRIKNAIADVLIILGTLMGVVAGTALTLQTAGLTSPMLPVLANLLMPSVAAVLTGFQLSKNELRTNTQIRIPTGVPGLTFSS